MSNGMCFLQNSTALVTGTLGLSFPKTADAMRTAVSYARAGPCSVLVDINWRPVFWESLSHKAVDIVSEYAGGADILKLSEEEAQWLYSVSSEDAMHHPEKVRAEQIQVHGSVNSVPKLTPSACMQSKAIIYVSTHIYLKVKRPLGSLVPSSCLLRRCCITDVC